MQAIICILEFINFMLILIQFVKFKQRIKFKKFELHNYGATPTAVRMVDPSLRVLYDSVRENVCNNSKNVKSHVFWILKKNVIKR